MGGPGDAVVAGPALLLDLDDADASAVAAEAAVLAGAAVARRGVGGHRGVAAAALLLVSAHLCTERAKGKEKVHEEREKEQPQIETLPCDCDEHESLICI